MVIAGWTRDVDGRALARWRAASPDREQLGWRWPGSKVGHVSRGHDGDVVGKGKNEYHESNLYRQSSREQRGRIRLSRCLVLKPYNASFKPARDLLVKRVPSNQAQPEPTLNSGEPTHGNHTEHSIITPKKYKVLPHQCR